MNNDSVWVIRNDHSIYGSEFYPTEEEAERVMQAIPKLGYYYFYIDELMRHNPAKFEEEEK